jgi:hypothetical protein
LGKGVTTPHPRCGGWAFVKMICIKRIMRIIKNDGGVIGRW